MVWWVVATFVIVIPLFVSATGENVFRFPKELLLRLEAILLAPLLGLGILSRKSSVRSMARDRLTLAVLISGVIVAVVTTALSTNRAISTISLAYFAACVIVFLGTYTAMAGQDLTKAIAVGVAAAVPNALLVIAQRLGWWNPFDFEAPLAHRMRMTALIGNPNDVGAYLAISLIAVGALAMVRKRPAAVIVCALLLLGVLAADALTAILAVIGGGAAMMLLLPRRAALVTTAAVLLAASGAFAVVPPLRQRAISMMQAFKARDYDSLTSHRIMGYAAAWMMFRDHPLTGTGPGTFKWHYMPYRLRVEAKHPEFYLKGMENLGETHSDHFQVLAEEGLLGYAVLLFAAVSVGSRSWALRNANLDDDGRAGVVRMFAFPFTVCFLLLAAAGFPMQLTAVTSPVLYFAACILRWSHDAAQT